MASPSTAPVPPLPGVHEELKEQAIWSVRADGGTCLICTSPANPNGTWVIRRHIPRHWATDTHQNSVISHRARALNERAQAAAVTAAATASAARLNAPHARYLNPLSSSAPSREPYPFEGWTASDDAAGSLDYWDEIVDHVSGGNPFFCDTNWGYNLYGPDDEEEDDDSSYPEEDILAYDTAATARSQSKEVGEYYPWSSKAMYVTMLLFSSPRLRFSTALERATLGWAKIMGTKDVPSPYAVKKERQRLKTLLGNPTIKQVSGTGDVYYMNDIGSALAKDMSNPLLRPGMQFFPEDGGRGSSQLWHGKKWLRDAPDELLTPMTMARKQSFYIHELARLDDDSLFIPCRFYTSYHTNPPLNSGETKPLHAMGYKVSRLEAGMVIHDERMSLRPVSTFKTAYPALRLEFADADFTFHSEASLPVDYGSRMPHPFREKAGNKKVYAVPVVVFMDDVSGNTSKQWNKHFNVYISNGTLPRETLDKEFTTRFVTTSQHVPPAELMRGVCGSVNRAHESGIPAWDPEEREEVILRPFIIFLPGDNPMQAEECSHGGLLANHFCRTCNVGGPKEYKASDEGYVKLFSPGKMRTPHETLREVHLQLKYAVVYAGTGKVETSLRTTGVKDPLASVVAQRLLRLGIDMRKPIAAEIEEGAAEGGDGEEGAAGGGDVDIAEREVNAATEPPSEKEPAKPKITSAQRIRKHLEDLLALAMEKDPINPLLTAPGVNIHQDTPTELLHTILLGIVKYFWGQTMFILEKKPKLFDVFRSRLNSLERSGMNVPNIPADYMCKHKGSLIGKHFKTIVQVMPFLVYDLISSDILNAWKSMGRLTVLLWATEIDDLESYLAVLTNAINDFLAIAAQCAPSIITTKPKFHFLVHIPFFIRRFGPAILYSTERYESFNSVFRLASIFSNRLAPSRDICNSFAGGDTMKHVATGGYWWSDDARRWVSAGAGVTRLLEQYPDQARLLGLKPDSKPSPGDVTLPHGAAGLRRRKDPAIIWSNTLASTIAKAPATINVNTQFRPCQSIVAVSGDIAALGSTVLVRNVAGSTRKYTFARLQEVLALDSNITVAYTAAVQLFQVRGSIHAVYDAPCIALSQDTVLVSPWNIMCVVNVQHDCVGWQGCAVVKEVPLRQERLDTSRMRLLVSHSDDVNFVVNINSLHNHEAIRLATPEAVRFILPCPRPNLEPIYKNAARRVRSDKASKAQEKAVKDAAVKKVKEATSNPTGPSTTPSAPGIAPQASDLATASKATTAASQKAPKAKGKARAMSVDEPESSQPPTGPTVPSSNHRPAKALPKSKQPPSIAAVPAPSDAEPTQALRRSTRPHPGGKESLAAAALAAQTLAQVDDFLDRGEGSVSASAKRKDTHPTEPAAQAEEKPRAKRSRTDLKSMN